MVARIVSYLTRARAVYLAVCVACMGAVFAAVPMAALAVESEGEKEVKKVTEQVSSEGIVIILAVLAGLVGLIAMAIILPKAVGFIKRFI
jgi:hypothetical protein